VLLLALRGVKHPEHSAVTEVVRQVVGYTDGLVAVRVVAGGLKDVRQALDEGALAGVWRGVDRSTMLLGQCSDACQGTEGGVSLSGQLDGPGSESLGAEELAAQGDAGLLVVGHRLDLRSPSRCAAWKKHSSRSSQTHLTRRQRLPRTAAANRGRGASQRSAIELSLIGGR
jgi:hypothetical protein